MQHLQDLQLTVLVALVLKNFLDRNRLTGFRNGGLEHHTKRAVSNDLFSVVRERLMLNIT